ncbi:MAG: hypothetical protein AAGK32_15340 [Actinomycetota bacterium]
MPRYGTLNGEYIGSWFERDEPGGPMWALNLMKYREQAEYTDGRSSELTGAEADEVYAPHEHLAAVGSRIILIAPVVHQLVGDDWHWDRIAIAQYRDRMAMVEMSSKPEFQEDEQHKEAGMDFTIVMASFPVDGEPTPPQVSGADDDQLLLLQVVGDASAPDLADGIESTRIGRFWVEDRMIGDDRTFAEARYDLISPATAELLAAEDPVHDEDRYVVVADPTTDEVARSLTDPTQVLF